MLNAQCSLMRQCWLKSKSSFLKRNTHNTMVHTIYAMEYVCVLYIVEETSLSMFFSSSAFDSTIFLVHNVLLLALELFFIMIIIIITMVLLCLCLLLYEYHMSICRFFMHTFYCLRKTIMYRGGKDIERKKGDGDREWLYLLHILLFFL